MIQSRIRAALITFAAISAGAFAAQRPADTPGGTVNGVLYRFYDNVTTAGALPDFTTLTLTSSGVLNNFLFTPAGGQSSHFGFQWTGYINIPTAGIWTFSTLSDDGSAFYIGNPGVDEVQVVVGNEGAHAAQEVSGSIDLAAGLHAFRVDYAQGVGGFQLLVSMAGPGSPKAQIPDSALFYRPLTPIPVIAPADPRIVTPSFNVTITASPGSSIYYTTNGMTPTINSIQYTGPVPLSAPVTIKAIAKLPNLDFSLVATQNFIDARPPLNDNFANAIPMGNQLTVTGSNQFATFEPGEPTHAGGSGGSIWYRWVPSTAGNYIFSTNGSGIDTTLAVYRGDTLGTLLKLGENDDATGDSVNPSNITSSLVAVTIDAVNIGKTHYIALDGFGGQQGSITLTIAPGPTLTVAATSQASENGPTPGTFTITRSGNVGTAFRANFYFSGNAQRGLDYKRVSEFVDFAAGQTVATVTITPIDDDLYEGAEAVVLGLIPSNYYALSPPNAFAVMGITDNDAQAIVNGAFLTVTPRNGFYSAPIDVAISPTPPDCLVRYTTDGSAPTRTQGTLYTGPLHVTGTTTLRAIAYRADLNSTPVATNTYIFTSDVIYQQPNGQAPPGWPAAGSITPSGQLMNYGMDPNIVAPNAGHLEADLKSIRTMCVTMNLGDLFNASTGIYANPQKDGIAWERPCNLEFLDPANGGNNWSMPCGARIRGGFSRTESNPKHGFRFFFRNDYGAGVLSRPLFGPPPAQQNIDSFDLRTFQNYSWSFEGNRTTFCAIRDVFSRDTQLAMSGFGCRGDYYHLYINGIYFGLYNTDERGEGSWAANYFGGGKDEYDLIKSQPDTGYSIFATDGTMDAWTRLWKTVRAAPLSNAAYFRMQGKNPDGTINPGYENLIEIDDLIDYGLLIYYSGNLGGPISNFLGNASPNDSYAFRPRFGNRGFRFTIHDAEHTLLDVNQTRIGPWFTNALDKSNGQWVMEQCFSNAEFRIKLADHIRRHFFNNGLLTPAACTARFNARRTQIQGAIYCESARWGDSKTTPACNWNDWNTCCNNIVNNYFPVRTNIVLNQLIQKGLYPLLNAPDFSQYGGNILPGFVCTITNPQGGGNSRIYYTTDGSDPRDIGGPIHNTATLATTPSVPVTMNGTTTLRARIYDGNTGAWSAMTEATFTAPQDFSKLRVTEINYNPVGAGAVDGQEFEFFEMKNTGTVPLNLTGAYFSSGIQFLFPNGSVVNPGQFVVLAGNPNAFVSRYPTVSPSGVYSGRLSNDGDTITLNFPSGAPIFSFQYSDVPPWPAAADGLGFSLVPKDPSVNYSYGDPYSWRASTNPGGSPGADDPVSTLGAIKINEALSHTNDNEFIELINTGNAPVDVSGWYLTDDRRTPFKFRVPNATIQPGQFLSISSTQYGGAFALSSHGDEVYVFSADRVSGNLTGYSHGFTFGAQQNGISFGRHVISTGAEHFVRQISRTPAAANSGPAVGPLVFSEVMYQPATNGDEFIEIVNITGNPVRMFNPGSPANTWKISGVEFTFPPAVTIDANSLFLVCGIDPATFRTKYNIPAAVPIFGPWTTPLADSGGHIELQLPDNPDAGFVPYVAMEILDYSNVAPWPLEPAGTGPSLKRKNPLTYGNDPANWEKSVNNGGSPGTSESLGPPAPTNLSAIATSFDRISLTWSDTTGENGYIVQRSPNGVSDWINLTPVAANVTSTQDTGLVPLTTYHYRVFATSTFGNSAFSNTANATTFAPPPPNAPLDLAANAISQSKIALSWVDASDSELGFKIERSPDGAGNWLQVGTTTTNQNHFTDQNLPATTTYYYRVRAYNITGDSDYTDVASATTQAPRNLGGHIAATIVGGHKASVNIELDSAGGERSVAFSLGFDNALFGNPAVFPDASLGGNVTVTLQPSATALGVTVARTDGATFGAGNKPLLEVRFNSVAAVAQPTNTSFAFGDAPTPRATLNPASLALETSYFSISASITPNLAPVADGGTLNVTEDIPANGKLNASDANGDVLTYSVVAQPAKGVVTITDAATGTYTYTPTLYTFGSDSFTFRANDGVANSNVATISVTITHVNHAPSAQNGVLSTSENLAQSGTLVAVDVDHDPVTYSLVKQGSKGVVTLTDSVTGAYTYTPNPGGRGLDNFTFKARDGATDSNTATVTVTINYPNHKPVALDGSLTLNEDEPKNGKLAATDEDADPLTYVVVSPPQKGTVTITNPATGDFTYTPSPLKFGNDSFTFRATDDLLASNVATISIVISHVNHAPVAQSISITTPDVLAVTGTVPASDVDGDALTFRVIANGTKGTAVIVAETGAFTYTPNGTVAGPDSFTFVANDGFMDSAPATVSVTLLPTPAAITSPAVATGNARENFQFTLTAMGTRPISFDVAGLPPGLVNANGVISGVPTASGTYPVVVTASNEAGQDVQLLTIVILNPGGAGNKPPQINSGPAASKNPAITGEAVVFTATASDENGDQLGYAWTLGDGTLDSGATISHVYTTPGTYVVTLTVSDGAASSLKTLLLAVNPAGTETPVALSVKKAQIALKFNVSNGDSATISGTLPASVNAVALGSKVTVFIGTRPSVFTLDVNGRAGSSKESLRLTGVKKGLFTKNSSTFTFALKKSALAETLKPFGLVNSTVTAPVIVPIAMMVGEVSYTSDVSMLYKGKAGKTGSAKK